MYEQYITHIVLRPAHSPSIYSERETAVASHVGIVTIRHLRALGLVLGEVYDGEPRYSEEDIEQLRRIRRLQRHLGINLAGVEVILHLLKRIEALEHAPAQERDLAHW